MHTCFLHRLGGMPEPRRRFGLTGGKFLAEPQRGVRRLRTAGTLRCPPRGQKGRDTCGFPSSLNSYLSLVGIAWVQTVDCVSRKRMRQSGYHSVSFSAFSQFTDSLLLHIRLNPRKRDIPVSRNSLTRYTARHLRIKYLVQFILVGAVYNNALTSCAALSCRACEDFPVCVAVMYLTLRTG